MRVSLPARERVPKCEVYVQIHQKNKDTRLGEERPVMMLVPGGPGGNHTIYDEIKEQLFECADVVLFDPRGCGYSSESSVEHCSMEDAVADIEALRDQLNVDRFVVLGGSYGAMVCLKYAVDYSDRLLGLILVAGSPSGEFILTAMDLLKKIGTDEQIRLGAKVLKGEVESLSELEEFYRIMLPIYLGKFNKGDIEENKAMQAASKKPPYFWRLMNAGFSEMLPKYDVTPELHKIICPTLLLAGENDWINNVSYSRKMHRLMPDSELVVFPQAGHFVWKGSEEEFFLAIKNYFRRHIFKQDDEEILHEERKAFNPRS